jgi:hypothetical protein
MPTTSNTEIVILWDCEDLLTRKKDLALLQNIPSMTEHINAWLELAHNFTDIGLPAAAGECLARISEYSHLPPGEYIRLIEGQIAELIQVPA